MFGTGADLQIYHDGSSSIIDNATGHLDIKNNSNDADINSSVTINLVGLNT